MKLLCSDGKGISGIDIKIFHLMCNVLMLININIINNS